MIAAVPVAVLVALVAVALEAGVGITTLGPGGIFVTVALYALTPLPSSTVAGTAQATFVATGLVGTAAYARSGELVGGEGRGMAAILSATSVVGALAGASLNAYVSRRLFGVLLGSVAAVTGLVLLYRERRELDPVASVDATTRRGRASLGLLGVPILLALGVAQVQSIFIAAFATVGYAAQGAVSLPLALVVGVPQVVGVVAGWAIAHRIDPGRLKVALGSVLVIVGGYLAV